MKIKYVEASHTLFIEKSLVPPVEGEFIGKNNHRWKVTSVLRLIGKNEFVCEVKEV